MKKTLIILTIIIWSIILTWCNKSENNSGHYNCDNENNQICNQIKKTYDPNCKLWECLN
jgi:ABC-type cobalt transport system substrate-binding protein